MKSRRRDRSRDARSIAEASWSPIDLGLAPGRYEAALAHLFDRPAPAGGQQAWVWDDDPEAFAATPLEWTRIQTLVFANAAVDLRAFSDDQVGMGLNFLMDNGLSDVPYAAIHESVPVDEAMRMMRAMPRLWRDGIGPRLSSVRAGIGSGAGGRLGHVCYMWFDVWPTFYLVRDRQPWRDAVWHVLEQMLEVPCREVRIAALHGIGHRGRDLGRDAEIDRAVDALLSELGHDDAELRTYANAAREGRVL